MAGRSAHCLADAAHLPFGPETLDAAATEPPYDRESEAAVQRSLAEMARALKPGGRLAVLCAAWQAGGLRMAAEAAGLSAFLDSPINRKGTECALLAWEKREDA